MSDQMPGFPQPSSSPGPGAPMGSPPGWNPAPPPLGPNAGGAPGWAPGSFPTPVKTSGAAIASLVLSLLWLCGVGSLLAVIFGIIGIKGTGEGKAKGRGMAMAGLIIGILGLLASIAAVVSIVVLADETVRTQEGEKDDVTIVDCGRDVAGFGFAELSVTNDSSKTSDYIISVSFDNGQTEFTASFSGVTDVDPDETATVRVTTTEQVTGTGAVSCDLFSVQRFASR